MRLRIKGFEDGFWLRTSTGTTVEVRRVPWEFRVSGGAGSDAAIGLECPALLRKAITTRLALREPAAASPRDRAVTARRAAWARLARAIEAERQRLIDPVPDAVLEVQRAVLADTGRDARLVRTEAFHRDEYLVRDVLRYPAARMAVAFLDELQAIDPLFRSGLGRRNAPRTATERDLALVRSWQGLFSPTGRTYRSLSRTLMNLPAGFPLDLLLGLPRVALPRPVTKSVELAAICVRALAVRKGLGPRARASQTRIYTHATEAQIRAAVARIGADLGRPLRATSVRDLRRAVGALAWYPMPHGGGLGGLVEKTLRMHREERERELRHHLARAGFAPGTPTARPPFPLPGSPQLRLLENVDEIVREGQRMRHCIATCAPYAVRGESFLFHVEYEEETASIEVDRHGRVIQARGPDNVENAASDWGRTQLEAWWARHAGEASKLPPPLDADDLPF